MEEAFWKLWYDKDEIFLAYSFLTTAFSVSVFFGENRNNWIILKKYIVTACIAGALFYMVSNYINYVNGAERHYTNALRFLNG